MSIFGRHLIPHVAVVRESADARNGAHTGNAVAPHGFLKTAEEVEPGRHQAAEGFDGILSHHAARVETRMRETAAIPEAKVSFAGTANRAAVTSCVVLGKIDEGATAHTRTDEKSVLATFDCAQQARQSRGRSQAPSRMGVKQIATSEDTRNIG